MRLVKKFLVIIGIISILFPNVFSGVYAATPITIVNVPTPTTGQLQGMVTAVYPRSVKIDTVTVTFDGDTTINYNGGLTSLGLGEIINYSFTVDVDGVVLATVMDVYPALVTSGTERVSAINVDNSTSIVALTLYNNNTIVDFYQASGIFVTGAGTSTSFGCQLVNYSGYTNPTTGHVIASEWGYMSDIPVDFISPSTNLTVNTPVNFYSIDYSRYGMPCLYYVSATGLPPGLTNNMGVISGTPTTPGTYTVTMTAMYGQHSVLAYSSTSSTITIVVGSSDIVPPTPVVDTTAPVITINGGNETLTVGDLYTDLGASAIDETDGIVNVTSSSNVDTNTAGEYSVTYSATDAAGNTSTATRLVNVNPAPVIVPPVVVTCSGTDEVITNASNARAGIVEIAGGPSNGGIAIQIFQSSTTINAPLTTSTFFQAGNLISYVGTMDATNICITTSATISAPSLPPAPVVDTTAPVITINGGNETLTVGDIYTDLGATAIDETDDIVNVTSSSNVDTTTAGEYSVTYTATDAAGNTSTATRLVNVNPAPVIVPPTTDLVSTGKKAEGSNKIITAISEDTISIGNLVIHITSTTTIKLDHKKPLKVGDKIEYKGFKNTDGSVTATIVKIQ